MYTPQIVLLLDADFLPAANFTDVLHAPASYAQLQRAAGYRQVCACVCERMGFDEEILNVF